jgi:glycosyltransferase involved in cell wall biosynthesis
MKTTCLINSHNYQEYIGEAVESALGQTCPFDKIVVVDDGSTDGSPEYLLDSFGDNPRVVIILNSHGGQLSCFNRGIEEVSTELVFFLDADDRYRSDYVETAVNGYFRRPDVDFLSVSSRDFGNLGGTRERESRTRDLGVSVIGALLGNHWVGGKTSCLSMRTSLVHKVLPYPHESEWIIRADDVLVFGSSAVGAYKRHLREVLVDYRVHKNNHCTNNTFHATAKLNRSLAINRLCNWFANKMGYDLNRLPKNLHREFRTCQYPTFKEWLACQMLSVGTRLPILTICKHVASTSLYFTQQKFLSLSEDRLGDSQEADAVPVQVAAKRMADAA